MSASLIGNLLSDTSVSIYVPSTRDVNVPLTEVQYTKEVDRALKSLASMFGGATAIPGQGAWVDKAGQLVKERVAVCTSYTSHIDRVAAARLRLYAQRLAKRLGQEAVLVSVNGSAYLVTS